MAASHQGETAIARRAIISTTSRAYPSDPAAPGPLADMARWRDKVTRRRNITPTPPAPVVSLRLACADADRGKSERPCGRCSRCDPLQSHRELLYQRAASPPPGRRPAAHWRNGKALTTISGVDIVPLDAFV